MYIQKVLYLCIQKRIAKSYLIKHDNNHIMKNSILKFTENLYDKKELKNWSHDTYYKELDSVLEEISFNVNIAEQFEISMYAITYFEEKTLKSIWSDDSKKSYEDLKNSIKNKNIKNITIWVNDLFYREHELNFISIERINLK